MSLVMRKVVLTDLLDRASSQLALDSFRKIVAAKCFATMLVSCDDP